MFGAFTNFLFAQRLVEGWSREGGRQSMSTIIDFRPRWPALGINGLDH